MGTLSSEVPKPLTHVSPPGVMLGPDTAVPQYKKSCAELLNLFIRERKRGGRGNESQVSWFSATPLCPTSLLSLLPYQSLFLTLDFHCL